MVLAAPEGDGYTIVEVIIFLAISAFIMAAAMNLIKGKQNQTYFSEKLRDTQSQLNAWINSSSSGFTGADPATQHCEISGVRPVVKTGSTSNYTPACVYLGKAIQFPPNGAKGSTIYSYSVFGVRMNGSELPTNLNNSSPAPAVGLGGGQGAGSIDLTQPFSLLPLYVVSVKSTGAITTSHLVGFYGSINTDQQFDSSNGQSDVNAYQYNFGGSTTPADQSGGAQVINCLRMSPSCGFTPATPYPDKLNKLDICLSDGNQYAQITITSSSGIGADVTLAYKGTNCT